MADVNMKQVSDWITHALDEVSIKVTLPEIELAMADAVREIQGKLEKPVLYAKDIQTYTQANQFLDFQTDWGAVYYVSYVNSDSEEEVLDVIDYLDTGLRRLYGARNQLYAYCVGRKLYLSWTVTADTDVTVVYSPSYEHDTIPGLAAGTFKTYLPILFTKVLRYVTLSDLITLHASTEMHAFKARLWKREANALMTALMNTQAVTGPVMQRRNIDRRNY